MSLLLFEFISEGVTKTASDLNSSLSPSHTHTPPYPGTDNDPTFLCWNPSNSYKNLQTLNNSNVKLLFWLSLKEPLLFLLHMLGHIFYFCSFVLALQTRVFCAINKLSKWLPCLSDSMSTLVYLWSVFVSQPLRVFWTFKWKRNREYCYMKQSVDCERTFSRSPLKYCLILSFP